MLKAFITEKININSISDSDATYTTIDGKDSTQSGIQSSIINDIALIAFVRNPDEGENQHYKIYLPDQNPDEDEPLKIDATKYNVTVMGV